MTPSFLYISQFQSTVNLGKGEKKCVKLYSGQGHHAGDIAFIG